MGERVQGGRLAARAIAAAGVDCVFTLSGGHVMPIYEGGRHEGVRIVDVRHEQSAAHAAEAWGRVRRACGVALVTAGPGVTGTVTAVANCLAAQTPLVVLGGARPLAQSEWGALQEFDQLSLMKPITKWAAVCPSTERIAEYVAIAFRHALAVPRGPVYLELPADILFADGDADVVPPPGPVRAFGDPREVVVAAELLSIGSELTVGETRDTNAGELAAALTREGVTVGRIVALPDRLDVVTEALTTAFGRADLVVSTGGLGPTPDDLTRESIAAALGETVEVDPGLEAWLRGRWDRRGLPMPSLSWCWIPGMAASTPEPIQTESRRRKWYWRLPKS